jgi:SAM-dependent methyltransferase
MKQCDLCAGVDFQRISDRDRDGRPLATCVCRSCGLVCHEVIPTDDELAAFYAYEYRPEYHNELHPSDRRIDRAWRNGQRILKQLKPFVPEGARVFEVGAGLGCTVKAFELAGFDAEGIDPGVAFAMFARKKLQADVTIADLFSLSSHPKYDLVLLVHVIEHFRSPQAALKLLRRMVRDGGRLYVECPNFAAPIARRSQLFHTAHVHNFTPQTLALLARRCGFRIERTLSSRDDPNLQVLLVGDRVDEGAEDPASYDATMHALQRAGTLRYHMRWDYLRRRVVKLLSYLDEHLSAKRRTAELLARCRAFEKPIKLRINRAA